MVEVAVDRVQIVYHEKYYLLLILIVYLLSCLF
jgi:hypothetical protein